MRIIEAQKRFDDCPEDMLDKDGLLERIYLSNTRPFDLIADEWEALLFQGHNPIGGEALELIIDKCLSDTIFPNTYVVEEMVKRYNKYEGRSTDKIRLFEKAFRVMAGRVDNRGWGFEAQLKVNEMTAKQRKEHSAQVNMSRSIARTLRDLDASRTRPEADIMTPEWVDSYTLKEEEFEFVTDQIKTEGLDQAMVTEFESGEFAFDGMEIEDFGCAGDGLHPALEPNFMAMQTDLILTSETMSEVNAVISEFCKQNKPWEEEYFSIAIKFIQALPTPESMVYAYVKMNDREPDIFVLSGMRKIKATPSLNLFDFTSMFGDVILDGAMLDKDRYGDTLNSYSKWEEVTEMELDAFVAETLRMLAKVPSRSKQRANAWYHTFKKTGSRQEAFEAAQSIPLEQSIPNSETWLFGYFRSVINGGFKREAERAGWDNWRTTMSPDGQKAFVKAIAEKKSFKDAMRAFWIKYNNTIVGYNSQGVTLRNAKIDWRRAYYKAKENELPESQLEKLIAVAKSLSATNNNVWVVKLATLQI